MDIQPTEQVIDQTQTQESIVIQYKIPRITDFVLSANPISVEMKDTLYASGTTGSTGVEKSLSQGNTSKSAKNQAVSDNSEGQSLSKTNQSHSQSKSSQESSNTSLTKKAIQTPTEKNPVDPDLIAVINKTLVGTQFDVRFVDSHIKLGDKTFNMPRIEFKDEQSSLKILKDAAKTGNVRVFFPGTFGTADVQEDRVNFQFDENGKLIRCFAG